ncbi:MAG: YIP1 family protein [Acidobacteriota bacterium]
MPLLPWDDRQRLGAGTAFVETIRLLAKQPSDAFARLRPDGDYVGPFVFGLIISWAMFLVNQVWTLIFGSIMPFADMGVSAGMTLVQIVMYAIFWPVIYAFILFLSAGIYHLVLLVLSGLQRSQLGFEGTYKIVAYAQVSTLANVIPLIGWIIGLVLQIVLLVVGFQSAHRTDQGRAIAAALIPAALCCLCMFVAVFFFGAAIMAAMAGAQ